MKNNNITLLFFIFALFISCISAYKVVGNKIYDPTGNEVLLRGIDRPSLEWDAMGERLSLSDYTLMKAWGANIVRVSLNQDFWFADTKGYKATIQQQVTWVTSLGMGCMFDLHWNNGGQQNMADRNSITFWSQFANAYKDNPWVCFELYNEPHDVSWQVWRNGDSSFAGMQELYNAIRATGSDNMVVVCGLNWAFDLSGVNSGYALTGNNISYGSHPYDFGGKQAGDWDNAFGNLAATYPVILTEFGQYCAQNTYVSQLMAYAQSKKIHWTAWAWFVQGCGFPSIISDWNGNPLGAVGSLVQQYLGGNTPEPPTTGPITPAQNPLVVYSDSLQNGFIDWSWSTSYSLSDSAHVHSGSSAIRLRIQAYEAIYFHLPSNFFTLGAYSTLLFYVYSTTSIYSSNLGILLYDSATLQTGLILEFPVSLTAGTWTTVSVPVSAFGIALSTQISGIAIQAKVDASLGDIWIDDVSFVPAAASTVKPTNPPVTVQPTNPPATVKPTNPPVTVKPTNPPTNPPVTAQPTNPPATVKPTNPPATVKPTNPATVQPTNPPATVKPTNSATVQPTNPATFAPTVKPTIPPSPSGCDATNIVIAQTAGSSWVSGGSTVTQFAVTISHTCPGKTLKSLTLTLSNWNPFGFWGGDVSGNIYTLPSYASITTSSPFTAFGYQNNGGAAGLSVNTYTFQ